MVRALAFFLVLLLVGLFALLNWDAFSALTPLNLGLTTVQAPLGLIMLGLVAFLCVLFTVWVVSMQASSLMEARRQTRELQAQRDLADNAPRPPVSPSCAPNSSRASTACRAIRESPSSRAATHWPRRLASSRTGSSASACSARHLPEKFLYMIVVSEATGIEG